MKSARPPSAEDAATLGVDPSFNRTGWALLVGAPHSPSLVACGVIIPRGSSRGERLLSVRRQFEGVLRSLRPALAYFERPGSWQRRGGSRRETVEAMAMARGVMLAACAEIGVVAVEVDFQAVRRSLLGRHNAGADSVLEFVRGLGVEPPRRPRGGVDMDVANAILMAAYGLLLCGNVYFPARESLGRRPASPGGLATLEPAGRPT
jgi:Holliday junction resolvasome RuvABC endonuclease subunit